MARRLCVSEHRTMSYLITLPINHIIIIILDDLDINLLLLFFSVVSP